MYNEQCFHEDTKGHAIPRYEKTLGVPSLMVSHNLGAVEAMCERAAWLNHGEVKALGPAAEVVRQYQQEAGVGYPERASH